MVMKNTNYFYFFASFLKQPMLELERCLLMPLSSLHLVMSLLYAILVPIIFCMIPDPSMSFGR